MHEPATNVLVGATTTAAGITVLPDTGSNPLLVALSILSIACGVLIISSFVYARLANIVYKSVK